MILKHVWIVFKKEVRDIARDRRTLITNLLIPIILMPLLFAFMGGGMSKMEEDIENITIALTAQSDTEEIRSLLENEVFDNYPNISLKESVEDPVEAIRQDDVRFVLEVESDYATFLEQHLLLSASMTGYIPPFRQNHHYEQKCSW
jgi:sodium transport system permease protein